MSNFAPDSFLPPKMFNRYWRSYPWLLQLVLFFLMILTLASFSTYLVLILLPKLNGVAISDIANLSAYSSHKIIRSALFMQAITHMGTFLAPALIFAALTHPKIRTYLGIRAPGKPVQWLLATGIMLGLIPAFLWGENWMMQHFHFGAWAERMQEQNDKTVGAFLKLNTPADLSVLIIVLAALPALGEELVFRGVLLRLLHRRVSQTIPTFVTGNKVITPDVQRTMVFPVVVSALLFSAIHFNPYGFIFILIAGCVLALIYFLTGSILCSIWAHFLYNGIQVVSAFFMQDGKTENTVAHAENLPIVFPLVGCLVFVVSFYLLVKNQTPLSASWSDDFAEE